jgi:hypothetical protein
MYDPVQEFQETLILQQGALESFAFEVPRIVLRFNIPRLFDIQFNKVEDYRAEMPLYHLSTILKWSATRDSEYLKGVPERRRSLGLPPRDLSGLCHFHMTLNGGFLDVLAEDYVFMMVSES